MPHISNVVILECLNCSLLPLFCNLLDILCFFVCSLCACVYIYTYTHKHIYIHTHTLFCFGVVRVVRGRSVFIWVIVLVLGGDSWLVHN